MLYFLASIVFADTGAEWLQKIDQQNEIDSAHTTLALEVTDSKGRTATRKMEIWQLGDHSRLVIMQEPARLKGISLLIQGPDNLHLFLPEYPPARRVLNSNRSDAFLGTDFAIDDLARMQYTSQYSAEYKGEEEKGHHLLLSPLEDKKQQQAELWCDDLGHILEIVHYNKKGAAARQLQFSEYKEINGIQLAHLVIVTDLSHSQSTKATLEIAEVNIEISSEIFTISNLEKLQ